MNTTTPQLASPAKKMASTAQLQTAVLLLIFNRPDATGRMIEAVRIARPSRLYIAADGPRADRPGESARCQEARKAATAIDWPCEVKTLFRASNLGCRKAVSAAIDWFFTQEQEGIILEDDCIPCESFFRFCVALLERYRDDARIMSIGGNNFQRGQTRGDASYYFSKYFHCWGWATWRRAWGLYNPDMRMPDDVLEEDMLTKLSEGRQVFVDYWSDIFKRTRAGEIDSWAYGFTLSCWVQNGLSIVPQSNLVSNIGTGRESTHTADQSWAEWTSSVGEIVFPLTHPKDMERNAAADEFTDRHYFRITALNLLLRRVADALPFLRTMKRSLLYWIRGL